MERVRGEEVINAVAQALAQMDLGDPIRNGDSRALYVSSEPIWTFMCAHDIFPFNICCNFTSWKVGTVHPQASN